MSLASGPIPFNTQFFHDDFDDGPGFDDDMDGGDGALPMIPEAMDEEGDLFAATQGPLKRVRPEFVNYARKAKRVDVRKLKENIWRGLRIVTPKEVDPEVRHYVLFLSISYSFNIYCFCSRPTRNPYQKRASLIHNNPARLIQSFKVSAQLITRTRWKKSALPSASFACSIWQMNEV